jgi:hypothetical protein
VKIPFSSIVCRENFDILCKNLDIFWRPYIIGATEKALQSSLSAVVESGISGVS